jgi:hypothetical protein
MKCIEKLRPVWLPSLSVAVDSVYQCVTPVKVLKGPVADSPSRASGGATGWPLCNQRVEKCGQVLCQKRKRAKERAQHGVELGEV